jgi:hypothetical protein
VHRKFLRFFIGLSVIASAALSCRETAGAAEDGKIIATFAFDGSTAQDFTAFVFVNTELAGAVPGTVELPGDEKPVAIEIGIPRLGPNPLYSLALGRAELENGSAEVVVSHYKFIKGHAVHLVGFLAKDAALMPNTKRKIAIQKTADHAYKLVLPAAPYSNVNDYLVTAPTPETTFHTVMPMDNKSAEYGVDHLSYDGSTGKLITSAYHGDETWSGSYESKAYFGVTGIGGLIPGLPLPSENWTIISDPTGAMIITEDGMQGATTRKIPVPLTPHPYLVLQKSGYADCVYERCQKQDTPQGTVLTCNLIKVK